MPLPTGDVIGILGDNLRLRRSVLPISKATATSWTRGLDLPRGGETVLYTGMMYQLIPYIEGLVRAEERLGDSWLAKWTGLGRKVNQVVNISAFMAWPSAEEKASYNQVPINVVYLLREAGVEFGALYEDDLYSGALAYDLGLDDVVAEHARLVHAAFKKHGVKTVITIDPHTTTMLRSVYPKLLDGYDVEVRSYLEVLAERLHASGGITAERPNAPVGVAIHDSCVFARYEGLVDEPRELLAAAGVLGGLTHHRGAQAGEVHLGEPEPLGALGHHLAEHSLQGALALRASGHRLAQDVQAPERAEDGDLVAHRGGAVGDDEGGHDLVEVAAEQDDRLLGRIQSAAPPVPCDRGQLASRCCARRR